MLSTGLAEYLPAGIASRYSFVYAFARSQSLSSWALRLSLLIGVVEFLAEADIRIDKVITISMPAFDKLDLINNSLKKVTKRNQLTSEKMINGIAKLP